MRVVLRKDCLGGEKIVDIELPRPVEAADLERLRDARFRQVFSSFPRPFFRVDVERRFLVTGVLGDPLVRFTVRHALAAAADDVAIDGAHELLGA